MSSLSLWGGLGGVLTSADGVKWIQQKPFTSAPLNQIAFGSGRFVAVGGRWSGNVWSSILVSSADGIDWVETWSETGHGAIAYGNGQFVADFAFNDMVTSVDGLHWASLGFIGPGPINDAKVSPFLSYAHGEFLGFDYGCLPTGGPICPSSLLSSTDAVNWAPASGVDFSNVGPQSAAYGNGQFILVGGAGTVLSSVDGTNWVQLMQPIPLNGITYGNGEFVAVGGHARPWRDPYFRRRGRLG
jgi:hypothetical protein